MGNGVMKRRVLVRACRAFRRCTVIERHVVNLVPPVQLAQHFESANLAAAIRGVQEVCLDPEDFHRDGVIATSSGIASSNGALEQKKRCPHNSRFSNRQMRSVASILPERCAPMMPATAAGRVHREIKLPGEARASSCGASAASRN